MLEYGLLATGNCSTASHIDIHGTYRRSVYGIPTAKEHAKHVAFQMDRQWVRRMRNQFRRP